MDTHTVLAFSIAAAFSACLILAAAVLIASCPPNRAGRDFLMASIGAGISSFGKLTGLLVHTNTTELTPQTVYANSWAVWHVLLFSIGMVLLILSGKKS